MTATASERSYVNNRIYIDGTEYTGDVIGIEDLQVTFALNDSTKTVNTVVSSDLVFIRSAFNYLRGKFYDTDEGRNEIAQIQIYIHCCDQVVNLALRGDATIICFEECTISTQAFDDSEDIINSRLISSTYIRTELRADQPKFRVCIDRGPLQEFFWLLIGWIFSLLEGLGGIIDAIFGTSLADDATEIEQNFIGCNNWLPGFFIKDIMADSLAPLNMTFESSIFQQGEYEYATWIDPSTPVLQGGLDLIGNACPQFANLFGSGLTIIDFLEVLKEVYNGEYQIIGNRVIFERIDFFNTSAGILVDVEQKYNDGKAACPTYSYSSEERYAAGLFQYTKDTIEESGNYAFDVYKDRVEWNNPYNPLQSGTKTVESPIGPARFVFDRFTQTLLDGEREPGTLVISHNARITRALPKIIVVQPQAQNDNDYCQVNVVSIPSPVDPNARDYNYPMYYNENYPNDTGQSELYTNFWRICDPREKPNVIQEIAEFEFLFDCSEVRSIFEHGIRLDIITRFGTGRAEEITVDFGNKTIIVKNVKIFS